jgi:hypothetical protein
MPLTTHEEQELTVAWIVRVWLICTATKSSYLVRAPGAKEGSALDGFFRRHRTALI